MCKVPDPTVDPPDANVLLTVDCALARFVTWMAYAPAAALVLVDTVTDELSEEVPVVADQVPGSVSACTAVWNVARADWTDPNAEIVVWIDVAAVCRLVSGTSSTAIN